MAAFLVEALVDDEIVFVVFDDEADVDEFVADIELFDVFVAE